jgi:hypothetical protein
MRRLLLAALTAAMLLGLAAPALAHPGVPLDPTMPTDLTHSATDNVEYLGRFPEHFGTAGGRLVGDRYYLTDPRGVFVYDVSTPESPELLGSLPLYQTGTGAALAQEEPDTDGSILVVDAAPTPFGTAQLQVVDVSDPANMQVLSSAAVTDHTWTCVSATDETGEVNECAYVYGRTGHIVDLTDPGDARLLEGTWRRAVNHGDRGNSPYVHDLTEIAPGLVMSAGAAAVLMDTSDPVNPVRLAAIEERGRFSSLGYHSVEWANGGRDPIVVLGTEIAPPPVPGAPAATANTAGSDCEGEASVIETWDASEIVAGLEAYEEGASVEEAFGGARFHRIDTFDAAGRGIFLEGQAPGHVLYCAHWMRLAPDFDGGGLMAVSYYDRGTRFVQIAGDGTMTEIGWITAAEGYSGSPRWVTDDVVYISDYRRGMEVVRLTREEATGVTAAAPDAIAVGSSVVPPAALDLRTASVPALGVFVLLALGLEVRLRRRRRTG